MKRSPARTSNALITSLIISLSLFLSLSKFPPSVASRRNRENKLYILYTSVRHFLSLSSLAEVCNPLGKTAKEVYNISPENSLENFIPLYYLLLFSNETWTKKDFIYIYNELSFSKIWYTESLYTLILEFWIPQIAILLSE